MHDRDGMFPDDVPLADAVEQQRPTRNSSSDDDTGWLDENDVPLEATVSDWQEQRETIESDFEEPEQY